tara:strand:- start:295 stop:495 length:201 start_codon:yes stop_codon:yes gene_type:complete
MLAVQVAKTRTGEPVAIGIAAPKEHFRDRKQAYVDLMRQAIETCLTQRTRGVDELAPFDIAEEETY